MLAWTLPNVVPANVRVVVFDHLLTDIAQKDDALFEGPSMDSRNHVICGSIGAKLFSHTHTTIKREYAIEKDTAIGLITVYVSSAQHEFRALWQQTSMRNVEGADS